ncbi:MFS general substrate transporter [Mycena albidolilacea]|uniref:MFS general substrate transporter n=1 Tax=Mycena albidolilacea TaxID=1033008 RepID=A0AAD6ZVT6_9AGAR|nr:MFS general substrate transporter [Mycena albidolilacea]
MAAPTLSPNAELYNTYSAFSPHQRIAILGIVCFADLVGPLSSLMYAPALPAIAESLHVSVSKINLTITTFLVFQGITPSIWGSIADAYGRRLTCVLALLMTLGSSVGLSINVTYTSMLVLRALNAAGSACMEALAVGILRDIIPPRQRGGYMGWYNASIGVGVAFGPVLGGLLTQYASWHGIFYFLLAWSALGFLGIALLLPETLRFIVGDGSIAPPLYLRPPLPWLMARSTPLNPSQASTHPSRKPPNFLGPILIMRWPDVLCSLFFLGITYTIWSNQIIATSTLYSSVYHLSEADIGLAYLSTGVGGLLGSVVIGKVMDHDYEAQLRADYPGIEIKGNEQYQVVNVEKARLRSLLYHAPLFLAGILIFGWTVSPRIHMAVSVVAMFAVGWLDCCIFTVYSTVLVDLFENQASMSSASSTLIRCLLGAVGTSTIQPMIQAMGTGWAFTTLTGIGVLIMPLVWFQIRFGPTYRRRREQRTASEENGASNVTPVPNSVASCAAVEAQPQA